MAGPFQKKTTHLGLYVYSHSQNRLQPIRDGINGSFWNRIKDDPDIKGIAAQMTWRSFETANGVYNFDALDEALEACARAGKGFGLQFQMVNSPGTAEQRTVPGWAITQYGEQYCITKKPTRNVPEPGGKELTNAAYNTAQRPIRTKLLTLIQRLGERYDSNPNFMFFTFGEPYMGDETQIPGRTNDPITSTTRRDTWMMLHNQAHEYFPRTMVGQFATHRYEMTDPGHMEAVMANHLSKGGSYGAPDPLYCGNGGDSDVELSVLNYAMRDIWRTKGGTNPVITALQFPSFRNHQRSTRSYVEFLASDQIQCTIAFVQGYFGATYPGQQGQICHNVQGFASEINALGRGGKFRNNLPSIIVPIGDGPDPGLLAPTNLRVDRNKLRWDFTAVAAQTGFQVRVGNRLVANLPKARRYVDLPVLNLGSGSRIIKVRATGNNVASADATITLAIGDRVQPGQVCYQTTGTGTNRINWTHDGSGQALTGFRVELNGTTIRRTGPNARSCNAPAISAGANTIKVFARTAAGESLARTLNWTQPASPSVGSICAS
jgi:hypothetical protein